MRKFLFQPLQLLFVLILSSTLLNAQTDFSGLYQSTGYFFHPTSPRELSLSKPVTKVGLSTYQTTLGDYGYTFQFSVDSNNNLTNWILLPGTGIENSGFMTSDNPGEFTFPSFQQPGDSPWIHSTYNNTYDSATKTFYVHYGYNTNGGNGEITYTRQGYEKLVFQHPALELKSFSPTTGTTGTAVTIKGKYLTNTYSVNFGGKYVDTFTVISDSEIVAIAGAGGTGNIKVSTSAGTSSIPGFTYIPVIVSDTGWVSLGNAGFSDGSAKFVSITLGKDNKPYVVFSDSAHASKARVMKLTDADEWVNVGDFVSEGACSFTNLAIDNDNHIYVAYIDSLHGNNITVKTFKGAAWKSVGDPGFAPCENIYSYNKVSIALDANNIPHVISATYDDTTGNYKISVMKFNGNSWRKIGNSDIGAESVLGYANLAIDKKTNTPYVVAEDVSGIVYPQLIVKKYSGNAWVTVGDPHFTTGKLGAYFPEIIIDSAGTPLVCVQEDNGREQASVYKFDGISWQPFEPRLFSPGHAEFPSLAVDRNYMPVVLFVDAYYNEQGTVMRYNSAGNGSWDIVGARGFVPATRFTQNALVVNQSNIPYIAFADKTKGNKVTVMRYEFVLPVLLTNFTAQLQKTDVFLSWQTVTETNTSYFNIQRSIDAVHFTNIGKIATSDNSRVIHDYHFTDVNAADILTVPTVYYRLQTTDKDNQFSYSKIVPVNIGSENISIVLWPNPVKDFLNIKIENYSGTANIVIFNLNGKKITEQNKEITNGTITSMATNQLSAGTYFLSIHINEKELKQKFIK